MTTCRELTSPVGKLLLAAHANGLTHLLFADPGGQPLRARTRPRSDGSIEAERILDDTESQLTEYFSGARTAFELPLAPEGTDFQQAVWHALSAISYGELSSYGLLAESIGRTRAVRAVGAANGANPISIIVPCHRVVGQDRRLTGYGGGLPAKRLLLELEGVRFSGDRIDAGTATEL
ncbi:MAG: methylated-DNA--[protein]-cysteine S-methyltransferase [Nannocystales bacterium]